MTKKEFFRKKVISYHRLGRNLCSARHWRAAFQITVSDGTFAQ